MTAISEASLSRGVGAVVDNIEGLNPNGIYSIAGSSGLPSATKT